MPPNSVSWKGLLPGRQCQHRACYPTRPRRSFLQEADSIAWGLSLRLGLPLQTDSSRNFDGEKKNLHRKWGLAEICVSCERLHSGFLTGNLIPRNHLLFWGSFHYSIIRNKSVTSKAKSLLHSQGRVSAPLWDRMFGIL